MFKKAVKGQGRLRLALIGPSGSGKTYTGLTLACALGKKVAVIDTEKGSATKYADLFDFEVCDLESFGPLDYVAAIKAAAEAGYDVLLIDSLSHAWVGKGGALEIHDDAVARQRTKNTFVAWREVTPQHNAMIEAIIQSPLHVIATMRTKTEYMQERDAAGKTVVRKVGMAPVQRDGLEYEFDVVADMDMDHTLVVSKSRCSTLADRVIRKPGKDLAVELRAWLAGVPAPVPSAPSAPAEEEPAPAPAPTPAKKPAREQSPAEAAQSLPTGRALLDMLAQKEAKLVTEFLCEEGELLRYLQARLAKAGFGGNALRWEGPALEVVISEVRAFEAIARKSPGACLRDSLQHVGEEMLAEALAFGEVAALPENITAWSRKQCADMRAWLRSRLREPQEAEA